MFAHAPRNRFGFLDFDLPRTEAGALVRAIAKRLLLRATAGAPPVFARLHFLHERLLLTNDGFSHSDFGLWNGDVLKFREPGPFTPSFRSDS